MNRIRLLASSSPRHRRFGARALAGGALVGASVAHAAPLPVPDYMNPDLVVVVSSEEANGFPGQPQIVDRLRGRPMYLLRPARGMTSADLVTLLQGTPTRFPYVGLNRAVGAPEPKGRFFGAVKNSVNAIGEAEARDANLPKYWTDAWFNAPAVHAISTGAGVKVAVLDTGVELGHSQLVRQLLRTPGGVVVGSDFVAPDNTPAEEKISQKVPGDAYGHGTHVAGVIARHAPSAKIMPIRVLDPNGLGTLWTVARGIDFAVDPDGIPQTLDGAVVVNMSFGAPSLSTQETGFLKVLMKVATCASDLRGAGQGLFAVPAWSNDRTRCGYPDGKRMVAMAGEGNDYLASALQPAAYGMTELLPVTASDPYGFLAEWATRGAVGQIVAPGQWITSAYPADARGDWAIMSGTSMATPFASATAALLLASTPPAGGWTGAAVIGRIRSTAVPLCQPVASASELSPLRALTNNTSPASACR